MSSGTPHQNGVIGWIFATLYFQMHVMMANTGLHENLKAGLWTEFAATATKLENIMVNPNEEKCSSKKFYGKIPD